MACAAIKMADRVDGVVWRLFWLRDLESHSQPGHFDILHDHITKKNVFDGQNGLRGDQNGGPRRRRSAAIKTDSGFGFSDPENPRADAGAKIYIKSFSDPILGLYYY